jgi:hypothetical protein
VVPADDLPPPPGAAAGAASEALRPEVAARVQPSREGAIAPLEARAADGFVDAATPLRLPERQGSDRSPAARSAEARTGASDTADDTVGGAVRQGQPSRVQPLRLVDLLREAAVAPPAIGDSAPRTLAALAEDLGRAVTEARPATLPLPPRHTADPDPASGLTDATALRAPLPPSDAAPAPDAATDPVAPAPATPTITVATPALDDPALLARLSRIMSTAGVDPQARFTVVDVAGDQEDLPLLGILATGAFVDANATLRVLERAPAARARLEAADGGQSVAAAPDRQQGRIVTLGELLGADARSPDTLYYVRTVQPGDDQGVWGIVQQGLTTTFARGIRLGAEGGSDLVTLEIPPDADELEGRRSSFLGRMIARKVEASLVYNLEDGRMGRNPHLIQPGQELVIVAFSPAELNAIHDHFRTGAPAVGDTP